MNWIRVVIALSVNLMLLLSMETSAYEDPALFNGFDVNGGSIAAADIYYNTEMRDDIPAIDAPHFLEGTARDGVIGPDERVLAIEYNGVAKAYPIKILDLHQIVNDSFNGKPVAVTFCPLCGTGMVFASDVSGKVVTLGVSGLIYNNNMLLYDGETESLWSQIMMTAVTGPMKGQTLKPLLSHHTTWGDWLETHPDSLLLSRDTGYRFDYDDGLYSDYRRLPVVMYPTVHQNLRIDAKSLVVGVNLGEHALALPFEQLDALDGPLRVSVGETEVEVRWNRASSTATVSDLEGNEVPGLSIYWFAWVAFYPETELYNPQP
ncbi:Uncharacterised protein [Halioglobus japonicus]|nr:Uncharacterised protein [Halioglobus japonicus]